MIRKKDELITVRCNGENVYFADSMEQAVDYAVTLINAGEEDGIEIEYKGFVFKLINEEDK